MLPTALPTIEEILARTHGYGDFDAEVVEGLATIARVQAVAKGTILFRVGDVCPGVFVVHSGLVRLCQTSPTGKVHVLRFAEPGHSFAEAAVLRPFNCPVQAEVVEDSVLVSIPAGALRERLATDHALCVALLSSVADRNYSLVRHTEDIALRDACGRVATYLREQLEAAGTVHLAVQKQDLARHLNLTSETLSRVLRRLLDDEIIASGPADQLRVVDRPALDALAWRAL